MVRVRQLRDGWIEYETSENYVVRVTRAGNREDWRAPVVMFPTRDQFAESIFAALGVYPLRIEGLLGSGERVVMLDNGGSHD